MGPSALSRGPQRVTGVEAMDTVAETKKQDLRLKAQSPVCLSFVATAADVARS